MITDEMVERAAETYWREHWGVFGNVQKDAIRRNMRAALKAAIEPQERDGWKLVPVEPTPEMIGAWYRYKNGHHYHDEPAPTDTSDYGAYRAMIAAAPPHTEGK